MEIFEEESRERGEKRVIFETSEGNIISEEDMNNVSKKILETIKSELPEEIQTYDRICFILKYTRENIKKAKISL
mgnify:CR=1 FL=1